MVLQNNSKAFSGLVGLQARLTIKDTKKEGGGEEASNGEGQDGSGVEGGGGQRGIKIPSHRYPNVSLRYATTACRRRIRHASLASSRLPDRLSLQSERIFCGRFNTVYLKQPAKCNKTKE